MKRRIRLDTFSDIKRFNDIATGLEGDVHIVEGPINAKSLRVNAKSYLGLMATVEFKNLWVESENDISRFIADFLVDEDYREF